MIEIKTSSDVVQERGRMMEIKTTETIVFENTRYDIELAIHEKEKKWVAFDDMIKWIKKQEILQSKNSAYSNTDEDFHQDGFLDCLYQLEKELKEAE